MAPTTPIDAKTATRELKAARKEADKASREHVKALGQRAKVIKRARKSGLTTGEIAAVLGVSRTTVDRALAA
jgi:DNA-binding NarL/FixJ family response regulator